MMLCSSTILQPCPELLCNSGSALREQVALRSFRFALGGQHNCQIGQAELSCLELITAETAVVCRKTPFRKSQCWFREIFTSLQPSFCAAGDAAMSRGYSTPTLLCLCALAFIVGRFVQQIPGLPEAGRRVSLTLSINKSCK